MSFHLATHFKQDYNETNRTKEVIAMFGNNTVTQIGFVVKDIEKTAAEYARLFGVPVPPITWTDPLEKAQTRYHGEPSTARARLAFFQVGQLSIELIEPDGQPSTWQDCLDQKGEGVHHIAFNVQGMKENIARLEVEGLECLQTGEYTGGRYAYLDAAENKFKVVLELLEND